MSGSGGVSVKAGPSARPYGRRRAQREAQRRYLRRKGKREIDDEVDIGGALLCGYCGQLSWPTQGRHDPHRDLTAVDRSAQPCTHCRETSWIDLGRRDNALAVRSSEEEDGAATRSYRGRMLFGGLMGLLIGWFLPLITGGSAWTMLLAATLGGTLGVLMVVRQHKMVALHSPPPLPVRWSMALPPAGRADHAVQGVPRCTAEPLRSPLTGRSCLAYEVGIRRDDEADGPLESWSLLEQRIAPIEVEGEIVDPAATHLSLPRQRLGLLGQLELDDAAKAFLRQRGIGTETTLDLFETIVPEDAAVRVALGEAGNQLSLLQALPGSKAEALPAASA